VGRRPQEQDNLLKLAARFFCRFRIVILSKNHSQYVLHRSLLCSRNVRAAAHSLLNLQTQIQKGFQRVEAQLADLQLDYPASPKEFASCKAAAEKFGWLPAESSSQASA
jgi:hypothetical protein